MRSKLNLVCAILALFCFVAMYIPVIAPRYPAADYHAASGSYESEYYFNGEYYLAKKHWSITDYAFAGQSPVSRLVVSLDQAILLIWAWISVSGQGERDKELLAAVLNLGVTGFFLVRMLQTMWACQWGVLVVTVLAAVMGVVLAANGPAPKGKGMLSFLARGKR